TPLAVHGLRPDALGRRFKVHEHPRLAAILHQPGPVRFSSDSPLPDPYDGLVENQHGHLDIHDCLGCSLFIDDRLWGVLTLDALEPSQFGAIELETLEAFGRLAAATVKAVERMDDLARRAEHERQLADSLRQNATQARPTELIGKSSAHTRLLEEARVVSASELTVLITGETGVGKELVAQYIHAHSPRSRHPLVSINCAALPETLVESELFGHVRGAFSGAVSDRRGKFELASGGTLFLDEIGDLPLAVQAKLLRVLQTGQLQRVGSDHEHHADVRVLAATNRDLSAEVRAGRFRADLYHRLSVYPLVVPPLRERGRDVLLLAGYFLEQYRPRLRVRALRLSHDAQAALLRYHWPGNVRELEHLIGRATLKALARLPDRSRTLTVDAVDLDLTEQPAKPAGHANADLPARSAAAGTGLRASMPGDASDMPASGMSAINTQVHGLPHETGETADTGGDAALPEPGQGFRESVDAFQRQLVLQAIRDHNGNWTAAAKSLQLDRANLHRLARRLGLKQTG
nr:nitric oxide reductase transcriptional regulator NorR [Pseudomonas sp.]